MLQHSDRSRGRDSAKQPPRFGVDNGTLPRLPPNHLKCWFAEWIEAVAEKGACGFTSGFGLGGCSIDVIQDGIDEWRVQIRTKRGVTGWVLASKFKGGKRATAFAFRGSSNERRARVHLLCDGLAQCFVCRANRLSYRL
jgi:hypothetical protein